MDFRLLEYRSGDPFYNMACDEAIFESFIAGESLPTVRFYGWSSAAVSIGYLQPAVGLLTPDICHEHGVTLVRRPTGGRAVAHGNDLTFSIVWDTERNGGIKASYRKTGTAVRRALTELGIPAEFCSSRSTPRQMRKTVNCFSLCLEDEVVVSGKKVLGCAQLRRGSAVLQQNSLALTPPPTQIALLFEDTSTSFGIFTGEDGIVQPSVEAVSAALLKAFEHEFGVNLVPGELSSREQRLLTILETKYRSFEWNAVRPKRSGPQLTVQTG